MAWTFHNPVAVTFGDGTLDRLGGTVGARRAVLVAFPEAAALGHLDAVSRVLGRALAGVVDDIEQNPSGRKPSLHLRETWPEAAIVDPGSRRAHRARSRCSRASTRRMQRTLPALVAQLDDASLRAQAALAALEAGLAFSNTRTALAHSISYEMTLRHGLPHGIACSFTLPLVLERALGRTPERDAVLARVFDVPLARAAAQLASWLEALGVSTAFESYGIAADESRAMVDRALHGARGRNFIGAAAG